MFVSKLRLLAFFAAPVLTIGFLAGCSSESSSQPRPVVATVQVAVDETTAAAVVGDLLEIQVAKLTATTIESPDTELVRLYQGTEIDGAEINPFVEALAPGEATITVTRPDQSSYDLVVSITNP